MRNWEDLSIEYWEDNFDALLEEAFEEDKKEKGKIMELSEYDEDFTEIEDEEVEEKPRYIRENGRLACAGCYGCMCCLGFQERDFF